MADGTVKITIEADGNKAIKSAKDLDNVFGQLGKGGNTDGLTSDLDGVAKHSDTAKIGVMDMAKSIGLVKVASSAFSFVTSGIGEVVKGLNESSATWKTFEGNMKGFGKSSAEIAKVKKELQSYAQATIYSASDMASTYAQLSAVGTKNTTQLVEGFGGLAAAAEDPQQAMKSLSQQATQMAAKPKVAWEDFKIMLEQTPAGMSAVAKEMGMSLTDLVKKIQDGSVKTDDFFNAIAKAGTNDTFGKMATQYKTVGEAMDGLVETLTNKLQPTFDSLSKTAIGWVSSFTDSLDNIDFGGMISGVLSAFTGLTSSLAPIFFNLKTLFINIFQGINLSAIAGVFSSAIKPAKAVFDGLLATVNTVIIKIIELFQSIKPAFDQVFSSDVGKVFGDEMSSIADTISTAFNFVLKSITAVSAYIASLNWVAIFTAVKVVIEAMQTSVKVFADILKAAFKNDMFQGLVVGILAAFAAFKTFATVTAIITSVATKVTALIGVIKNIGAGISILFQAIKSGKEIVAAFNLVLGVNPFILLGAAIAAVVAGLVYFFTKTKSGQKLWADFTKFLSDSWNSLKESAVAIWKAITDSFTNAVDSVKSGWNGIVEFFVNLWEGIKSAFSSGVSSATSSATSAWSTFIAYLSSLWTGLVNTAQAIFNGLATFFTAIWNGIVTAALAVWYAFGPSIMAIWTGVVTMAQGVWELLKSVIMGPILILIDLITGDFTQLGADLNLIWTSIVNACASIWNGLVSILTGIFSSMQTLLLIVWTTTATTLVTLWTGLVNGAIAIWNGFSSFMSNLWNAIKTNTVNTWNSLVASVISIINSMKTGAINAVNNLKSGFINAGNAIKSGTINAWNSLRSGVINIISGLVSGAISMWNGLRSGVINIAHSIATGAVNAWQSMVSGVTGIISAVKGIFNSLANIDLVAAGKAIIDGFVGGLKSAWEAGKKFIGGIGNWIREHKGPISYDKKLLIPAGKAIIGGLNDGLINSFGKVKSSIASITEGIANSAVITMPAIEDSAFNKSLKRINNTLNGNRLSAGLSFAGITAESASGVGRGVAPTNSVVNNYSNTATTTVQTAKESNDKVLEALNKIANNRPVAVVDGSSFAPAYEPYGSTETARRSQMKGRGLAIDSKF